MNRDFVADKIEEAGKAVFEMRDKCANGGAPFCAGLLRAAEEALMVAMNALRDQSVKEGDL